MNSTTIFTSLLTGSCLLALSACADEPANDQPTSAGSETVGVAATTHERPVGAPTQGSCAHVVGAVDLCSDHSGRTFALKWTSDGGASWDAHSFGDVPPLLWSPATSLSPGVLAAVGGGDGATLAPFQMALRSDDLGETWQTFDLPRFDGQMAYVGGSVVTADGRLLSLLTSFSDDAPGWEADRQHGLYVSAGADWSEFSPILPEFTPALKPAPPGESALQELSAKVGTNGGIRVRTWDGQTYVSTDDAASFHERLAR